MTVLHSQTYAALAAAALVVVGTSYVVTRGSEAPGPATGPSSSTPSTGQPPLPTLQTDAANRTAAVREADRLADHLPVLPDATETDRSGVPELAEFGMFLLTPAGHTVTRQRWWTASGTTSATAARWYAAHPPAGFTTEGGATGVGGSGDGRRWADEVTWDGTPHGPASGTSVEVQTTATADGVGIRLTVLSVWPPARPAASFVQDVSSIDVLSTHEQFRSQGGDRTTQRRSTVSDPARVLRAAIAYDDLPGMTPVFHSCPMPMDSYTDRITFHTAAGDVVATERTRSCGSGVTVHRDGHLVDPQLGDPSRLFAVLGLDH